MTQQIENYDVHICRESELPQLQKFIHEQWKKNHSLATSNELMRWQHYDADSKCYNFVIATHIPTKEIHGILGFIPTNHFDETIQTCDLWLAIWKVRDDVKVAGLGLYLYYYLAGEKKPRSVSAFGLSEMVIPIYQYLGFKTGLLNQYYMVNKDVKEFHLIGAFDGQYVSPTSQTDQNKKIVEYNEEKILNMKSDLRKETEIPGKSLNYFCRRYGAHPVYKYLTFGLLKGENLTALVVLRKVSHGNHCALRLVDYYGPSQGLAGTEEVFQTLMEEHGAEYVDFYNVGFQEKLLNSAGFIKRDAASEVVVPNYYEPFEKKNVNLDFAYKVNDDSHFLIVKGDSDQDRPNLIVQGAAR